MEERLQGPALFSRSWFAPLLFAILFVALAFLLFGMPLIQDNFPPESGIGVAEDAETPEIEETPTVKVVVVVVTSTPTQTPEPTFTATALPSPTGTPTPAPRPLSKEQFEYLMVGDNFNGGLSLLSSGYGLYDDQPWSAAYPCPARSCILYDDEVQKVIWDAYEQNNDANYWCEWISVGVIQRFGQPYNLPEANYNNWQELVGSPSNEVFCPQFEGEFEDFSSSLPVSAPTEVPHESYGWSDDLHKELVQKYFVPIIEDGWPGYPRLYGLPYYGIPENLDELPDSYVCFGIADGHYYYGFPEYEPARTGIYYYTKRYAMRLELREKLVSELAESVDGKPPLCPDFLGMIAPYNLP